MNKRVKDFFRFSLFLSVGIVLLCLVYKDIDQKKLMEIISNDVKWEWIFFSLVLGLFSHISRSLRWIHLIKPFSDPPRKTNSFLAVMVSYLANLALPRMGEITRCGVMSKYEDIPFPKLVGTVVLERIIDVLMLGMAFCIVLFSQFSVVKEFLQAHPSIGERVISVVTSLIFWCLILAGLLALWFFRRHLNQTTIYRKVAQFGKNLIEGVKSIGKLEKPFWFWFHSVFIWVMYFLMNYVCFQAFNGTNHLPPLVGLVVFVAGSLGMVAPVQGGIGPWHFMTISALMLYGVDELTAGSFALVVHGTMTMMLIILGFISLVVLPLVNREKA